MQLTQTQPQAQGTLRSGPQSLKLKSVSRGALLATACLAFASLAHAQSTVTPNQNSNNQMDSTGSWRAGAGNDYIGLNAGASDLARPISGLGVLGGNQQSNAYSVSMGHYFVDRNYGFEVGYTDFGSINRAGGSTKVDGINLSFIGRAPIGQSFNLLGKIGTTYGRTDVSSSAASGVQAGSERGFDVSYGIGAEYLFRPNWSGVLQYDEHYVKYPGNRERVSATTLGVRYRY